MREYALTLLVAAAVTYILTPLVRRWAVKVGALHEARDRDVHVVPIPRMGGLAMYAGLAAGLLAAGQMTPLNSVFRGTGTTLSTETGLLLAGALIVAIGLVDDRWGMSPISKLAGQVAAAVILIASGTEIGWLPLPGGTTFSPSPDQSIVLTILVVVATINAVNFIDGLDGLAAGVVAIAAFSFFIYYYSLAHVLNLSFEAGPALVSAVLAGMCLGFLPHNFFPAKIFMGDTGSMLLGLLLAYAPISSITSLDPQTLTAYKLGTVNRFPELLPLLVPTAILVIPYADMLLAVFRRTRAGKSPFAPDRKHLHHRLLDIGRSHRSSVIIMYLWAALFSGAVVSLSILGRPTWVFAAITAGAVLVLLLMSMPRLRWWTRDQRRAVTPAPAAAGLAAAGVRVPAGAAAPAGGTRPGSHATSSTPRPGPRHGTGGHGAPPAGPLTGSTRVPDIGRNGGAEPDPLARPVTSPADPGPAPGRDDAPSRSDPAGRSPLDALGYLPHGEPAPFRDNGAGPGPAAARENGVGPEHGTAGGGAPWDNGIAEHQGPGRGAAWDNGTAEDAGPGRDAGARRRLPDWDENDPLGLGSGYATGRSEEAASREHGTGQENGAGHPRSVVGFVPPAIETESAPLPAPVHQPGADESTNPTATEPTVSGPPASDPSAADLPPPGPPPDHPQPDSPARPPRGHSHRRR